MKNMYFDPRSARSLLRTEASVPKTSLIYTMSLLHANVFIYLALILTFDERIGARDLQLIFQTVRSARLATTVANSTGSTGLGKCS